MADGAIQNLLIDILVVFRQQNFYAQGIVGTCRPILWLFFSVPSSELRVRHRKALTEWHPWITRTCFAYDSLGCSCRACCLVEWCWRSKHRRVTSGDCLIYGVNLATGQARTTGDRLLRSVAPQATISATQSVALLAIWVMLAASELCLNILNPSQVLRPRIRAVFYMTNLCLR